jgi:hypothetical protein
MGSSRDKPSKILNVTAIRSILISKRATDNFIDRGIKSVIWNRSKREAKLRPPLIKL